MMGMGMGWAAAWGRDGHQWPRIEPRRIDVEAKLGTSEIWSVSPIMMAHPFHIHGVTFNVLSLGGR